jgi:hypothetical protein
MSNHIEIYLRSSDATQIFNGSYNSDTIFLFKQPIIVPNGYNMIFLLKKFNVPVGFYIIDDTNNQLYVNDVLYTISQGNHTAKTLQTELSSVLPSSFSISYDTIKNTYTFTNTTNFTFNNESTILRVLGFNNNVDVSSTGNQLTSIYPIDLSGQNTIYIDVPNIKTFNLDSRTGLFSSTIASINSDVPYGNVLYYEDAVNSGSLLQEDNLTYIHLRILGEDGITLLNLQNNGWSATFTISFTPKTDGLVNTTNKDFNQIYKNYVMDLINKNNLKN